MLTIFHIALAVGIILPIISLIGNALFSVFDNVLDAFHLGLCPGDMTIGFLPVSAPSIYGGLIVFGGVGKALLLYGASDLLALILSIVWGYVVAVVIQTFLNKLRNHKALALTSDSVLTCEKGKVVNAILPHRLGKVSFEIDGQLISFIAKAENPEDKIAQNSQVEPIGFENKILVVRLKEEKTCC